MSDRIPVTTFAELKRVLGDLMPSRIPAIITGTPGIGKTAVCQELVAEGEEYLEIRPANHQAEDFKFPVVDPDSKTIDWVQSLFPTDPDWKGIIAIDELGQAERPVQAALLGLMHFKERRLGEYHLPAGAKLVATTNGMSDRAGSQQFISPLVSRVCHIDFVPNTGRSLGYRTFNDEVCEYLLDKDLPGSESVISYLRSYPNELDTFNPDRLEDSATPRSWEMTATAIGKKRRNTDLVILHGIVGPSSASKFDAHRELSVQVDPLYIIKHPDTAEVHDTPSLMWATVSSLAGCAKDADDSDLTAICKYLVRCQAEFAVFGVQDAQRANKRTMWAASQTDFFQKYGPYVRAED